MASGPKYPNQQLRSVSLETYFPGCLRSYAAMGGIQEAVRDQLPNLFVPQVSDGEALALRPFQLRDKDQTKVLALAVNQVSYVSFNYPGFEAFKLEALPLLSRSLEAFGAKELNRVVYRYENAVGIARKDDGTLPVAQLFPKVLPDVLGTQCRAIDARNEAVWAEKDFAGAVGFHARTELVGVAETFVVTVFASVEKCEAANLERSAVKAHDVALATFEHLISDEFRQFISAGG